MERKLRKPIMHKGKPRHKRRLPRKVKKTRNKKFDIELEQYFDRLKKLHGDNWMEYIIYGG